ncbi:hypothetical protein A3B52_02720 [Candidatus Curtissbacteria bacterium RIFCSPLOWO2_01_FULL_41_28]|uniref:Uncharacterized protein n=1 Tax=Candidatus Curtissbacteria bacterium RIFOXYA1_FULL_41_14 TaxID=1797737 RepID=A0A1F5HC15_9BACT|nr:MAG: hypothetical protein A2683_00735 [Candidatus Curtissbacteria bacterium RIFCSPHIGHO2_01_FULL_34_40]OGD91462.1 MAG: hypothetical protein A3E14_00320 [Candidatus Curtissbacteria bacterium RIFCSPHIGHO2_12_FULL_41_13]OGD95455.1 MAG: hypothetical protein A3B52_02720 [Candidatus Curtissbacteria bacterium RIFCSPLOWO2_01_FULL_41_28]OGE01693.1 MAG: hypothetical protein A2196_02295 [Candidatus Curtissbacteria bacterium RIFOXYA1_FULL_41_14]OGE04370.1 MAG: hypothetical protein A2362_02270 [Candidatu
MKPNKAATKSKSKSPIKPQFKPPITTRIIASQSQLFIFITYTSPPLSGPEALWAGGPLPSEALAQEGQKGCIIYLKNNNVKRRIENIDPFAWL